MNGNLYFPMAHKISNYIEIISLFRSDYSMELHVREIARLLKRSHTSVGATLKEMEVEGYVISKMMGRTKAFKLNKECIVVKELISLAENIVTITFIEKNPLFKRLKEEITDLSIKAGIILFGSYVKGYANDESDIDIFCLGDISKEHIDAITLLGKKYMKKINVKTINEEVFRDALEKRDPLSKEIIKDHIILANHNGFLNIIWELSQ